MLLAPFDHYETVSDDWIEWYCGVLDDIGTPEAKQAIKIIRDGTSPDRRRANHETTGGPTAE